MNFSKGYIIAEIGVNHFDIARKENIPPIDAAKLMIKNAKESGAHAVKFQTYKTGKIVSKNSPAYWDTTKETSKTQYDLFLKFDHFNKKDYVELSKYSKDIGVDFMSTPFDLDAVDFLNEIQDVFKVASADITNYPLLKKISKIGKPMIISTGASTIREIHKSLEIIREINPNVEVILLHCVLSYPTKNEDANLKRISFLQKEFSNIQIGYSDHTLPSSGMAIVTAAYALGAKIIEKHFTLDKSLQGNDHYHAMDCNDLKQFRDNIEILNLGFSKFNKNYLPCEETSRKQARRSLVLNKDLKKRDKIRESDIICKRPGTGIETKKLYDIIGKVINKDLQEDHILTWEDIK